MEIHERLEGLKKQARRVETSVMKTNIYKRGMFERLVGVYEDIQDISAKTHLRYEDVLHAAGIKDPNRVLDEAVAYWDGRLVFSEILSENALIERLRQDFQLNVRRVADVFVPPDTTFEAGFESDTTESQEKGEDVDRVSLAIDTLIHMQLSGKQIALNDLEVKVGKVPEHGSRTRPYWVINLEKNKIAVLLNNQFGNRTFVLGYQSAEELDELIGFTKEQLKQVSGENLLVHHFIYEGPEQFKGELAASVQKVFEGKERNKVYETYEEAKKAAQALGIKTPNEYRKRYREDPRLPSSPPRKYPGDFISWGNFLRNAPGHYLNYGDAKNAVRTLGIRTEPEYRKRYKEDPKLPSSPSEKYGDDFTSWGDFLGTGKSNFDRAQEVYQTYEDAKAAVKGLHITSVEEYKKRYKEDPRLPCNPQRKYVGFSGWSDFLGTENLSGVQHSKSKYQTYGEAKAAAQALGIKSVKEYLQRYKEDSRLNVNPEEKYGDDFVSWGDFLGTGNLGPKERAKQFYQTYEEASDAAKRLGITRREEYGQRHHEDPKLPALPHQKYGKSFLGWDDFLGRSLLLSKKERRKNIYQSCEEASEAARGLEITSKLEYERRRKEDPKLPSQPNQIYGKTFRGWADFLGTRNLSAKERKQQFYQTYEEARAAVRALGILNSGDYKEKYKLDPSLPAAPDRTYGKDFKGWADFLGTE